MTYLAATSDIPITPFQLFKGYTYTPAPLEGTIPTRFSLVFSNIIGFLTLIAGLAFIFYFLLGAINWITAGGDTQKSKLSRMQIINALIGLVVVIIANPVIALIGKLLGIPLLSPQDLINQFIFP